MKKYILICMVAALALAVSSCGGGMDTTSYGSSSSYYSGGSYSYDPYPYNQYYTVYLKVADKDGNPLGGVTVWVNDEPEDSKTSSYYSSLGYGYPDSWQGWNTNFSTDYHYTKIDYEGDTDEVTVSVSKTGYEVQSTTITVPDNRYGSDLMYRITFIMEPEAYYF